MKASQVVIFEKDLADRARMTGWDKGMQNILKFTKKDGKIISIIAEYGKIDAKSLHTACGTFI